MMSVKCSMYVPLNPGMLKGYVGLNPQMECPRVVSAVGSRRFPLYYPAPGRTVLCRLLVPKRRRSVRLTHTQRRLRSRNASKCRWPQLPAVAIRYIQTAVYYAPRIYTSLQKTTQHFCTIGITDILRGTVSFSKIYVLLKN